MAAKKRRSRLSGVDDFHRHFGCEEGWAQYKGSKQAYVCKVKPKTPRSMSWEWTVFDDARRDRSGKAKLLGKGRAANALIAMLRADAKLK